MSSALVFEVTRATFEAEVLPRSKEVPVLLDFWADWCGPCKTMGPLLEQVAKAYGGAFVVGKVDTEKEAELAALFMQRVFQVQSIPFFVLLVAGQPVDAFTGAVGEAELREFLSHHKIKPRLDQEEAEAVGPDPTACLAQAMRAVRTGDVAAVRQSLEELPEDSDLQPIASRLRDGLDLFEAQLEDQDSPAAAPLVRARQRLLGGHTEEAMAEILEAVAADKAFAGGLPRRAMLLCFVLAGEDAEVSESYRRRMATLLY